MMERAKGKNGPPECKESLEAHGKANRNKMKCIQMDANVYKLCLTSFVFLSQFFLTHTIG